MKSMKANLGQKDKAIRLLVAVIVMICYFFNVVTGTAGLILLSIAAILILTSLVSLCPLYTILGINTCKTNQTK